MRSPVWIGQSLFVNHEYAQLEAIVRKYAESDTRSDDGSQALHLVSLGLNHWFGLGTDDDDSRMVKRLATWNEQAPWSALQPIVNAMYVKATAWRARGRGYSSTVSPEGWRLFEQRNQQAWKILMDNEKRSSVISLWYREAIEIGSSLGMTDEQLRELFEAGMRKHPGDQAIYSQYMQHFAPLWGGDWKSADEFIRKQSAARANKEGDTLYARLYWFVDQSNNRSPEFFEESLADWPRMRRGFEKLTKAFPYGVRSHARFAVFACRANDGPTYLRLRPELDRGEFADLAPSSVSVDVCDARFKAKLATSSKPAPAPVQWVPGADGKLSPLLQGQSLFENGNYAALEAVVSSDIQFDIRAADGTQVLWYLTYGLDNWLQWSDGVDDQRMASSFSAWQTQFPQSTLQPIVAAMYARASAWRARGQDFASTVTPEGWRLFKERNQQAWKILTDHKERSSANPMWYHEAIYIGVDLGFPRAQLRELFDEGLLKHPDYYAIYSAYMRSYAPRWGGDWESADKFIVEQSAAKGDSLYARLYWYLDDFNTGAPEFFEESLANWPRMRQGFEQLMAAHPNGARNQAAFASFACRANDAATYTRLRPNIDRGFFKEVAPRGVSVDMCDARFIKPA